MDNKQQGQQDDQDMQKKPNQGQQGNQQDMNRKPGQGEQGGQHGQRDREEKSA